MDERLRVCGTCVYYVPRQDGCIIDFMEKDGHFYWMASNRGLCQFEPSRWTPYWEESLIEGACSGG